MYIYIYQLHVCIVTSLLLFFTVYYNVVKRNKQIEENDGVVFEYQFTYFNFGNFLLKLNKITIYSWRDVVFYVSNLSFFAFDVADVEWDHWIKIHTPYWVPKTISTSALGQTELWSTLFFPCIYAIMWELCHFLS